MRKMQIKIATRYFYTLMRRTKIEMKGTQSSCKSMNHPGFSKTASGINM